MERYGLSCAHGSGPPQNEPSDYSHLKEFGRYASAVLVYQPIRPSRQLYYAFLEPLSPCTHQPATSYYTATSPLTSIAIAYVQIKM